jgi:hypothetical protein
MSSMNVNTVRTFIDIGFDQSALDILDEFYRNDIMVIMTVDDAINDLQRVAAAVNFYKDHPAILMWNLGSEWNINRYFRVASSVPNAAQRTEAAAQLIKSLDLNHPVATSYGDIDINAAGLRLTDTAYYVNSVAPSVDVWGLNIYRGSTFGDLFDEWASISSKPMFIGEFGTDAYDNAVAAVDEAAQAQWDLSLWHDLFWELSKRNPGDVALGGTAFVFNDEWWKVAPHDQHDAGGFAFAGAHPDDFANEEYFGLLDIDRVPRQAYFTFAAAFSDDYLPPPPQLELRAVSRGALAAEYGWQYGVARFYKDGVAFYEETGGGGGGRGFNFAVVDPSTGEVEQALNFDTYGTRSTGTAMLAMIAFLNAIPAGKVVMAAVADEAGLNVGPSDCSFLAHPWVEAGLQALEELGSRQIRSYCFWNSWAMMTVKGELGGDGEPQARAEMVGSGIAVEAHVTLTFPADADGDGYEDEVESFLGTAAFEPCAATSANDDEEGLDAWPVDSNDDQLVNLFDVVALKPHFNKTDPDPGYEPRFDLDGQDGSINLLDVLHYKRSFLETCAP